MAFRRRRRQEEGINPTPLVDVMFQLLIFVVITAQYSHLQALKINLPKAKTGAAVEKADHITIVITRDETIYLNQQEVSPESLKGQLASLAKKAVPPRVMIQADEGSTTGQLVRVMDLVSEVGLKRVSLETRKDPKT